MLPKPGGPEAPGTGVHPQLGPKYLQQHLLPAARRWRQTPPPRTDGGGASCDGVLLGPEKDRGMGHTPHGGPGTGSSADRPGRRDRTGSVPGGQSRGGGRQLVAAGGRARGAAAAECGASLRGDGASGGRWVLSGMRSPKRPLRGGGNPQVGGSAEGVPAGTRRPERATMKGDCGPLAMLSCSARREIRHGPGVVEK